MGKSIEVAKALLEDMTANNYHWSNEWGPQKKSRSKYEVDAVDMLASKVDALARGLIG